jgi:hypothetical protein
MLRPWQSYFPASLIDVEFRVEMLGCRKATRSAASCRVSIGKAPERLAGVIGQSLR